jgi:hypothetical protein
MGSLRFDGVVFQVYPDDHPPPHVHAKYAGIEVIVRIWPDRARLASRKDAVRPPNAKRSDVSFLLKTARLRLAELNMLWEGTHGT